MTELAWTATRADTIDRFNGQTPRPEDEATIIDVFETHPTLVLRAIDETAEALNNAKITWAWSVLRARLERGTTALREATANTKTDRTKRIHNAEAWISNAGIHYDQERDVEEDLFGESPRGRLYDYRHDQKLRDQLLELWRQQRPRGSKAEANFEAWNAQCAATYQRIRDLEQQNRQALIDAATDPPADQTDEQAHLAYLDTLEQPEPEAA